MYIWGTREGNKHNTLFIKVQYVACWRVILGCGENGAGKAVGEYGEEGLGEELENIVKRGVRTGLVEKTMFDGGWGRECSGMF